MKTKIVFLLAGLLAAACGSTPNPVVEESSPRILPPGAIPVTYYAKHLYLDGAVCDSLPMRLVFDSGADLFYVDSLWLARSGYAPGRTSRGVMRGGGGSNTVFLQLLMDTLRVRTAMDTLTVAFTPVIDLKNILGRSVDGIIGQSPMAGRCLEIDYYNEYMRCVAPDTLEAAGYTKLPFRMVRNRIYLPMRVRIDSLRVLNGEFMLDLGSGSSVVLTVPAAKKLDMDSYSGKKVFMQTISGGIGGHSASCQVKSDSVTLAGFAVPDVLVDVSQNTGGILTDDHFSGLIGNELLERFSLVIDYPGSALYLKPNMNYNDPQACITAGFSMIDRTDICDGWVVTGLYDSYAPVGLQARDTLVRWNGQPVTELDIMEVFAREGRHKIGVKRGAEIVEMDCETKKIF